MVEKVYIAKRGGKIYGVWRNPPEENHEVAAEDHPDVAAFFAALAERPKRTPEQKLARLGLTPADLKQLLS